MPYRNIVFVKLEKRLLNDHRWFMMSEGAQLLYIKLILLAASTHNLIPKNEASLVLLLRFDARKEYLRKRLMEVKSAFPKFKETTQHYYFEDFEEKTNYIKGTPREIPSISKGTPRDGVDKEIDKDKKKKRVYPNNIIKDPNEKHDPKVREEFHKAVEELKTKL